MDQFIREIRYVICVFHQAIPSSAFFPLGKIWIKDLCRHLKHTVCLHEMVLCSYSLEKPKSSVFVGIKITSTIRCLLLLLWANSCMTNEFELVDTGSDNNGWYFVPFQMSVCDTLLPAGPHWQARVIPVTFPEPSHFIRTVINHCWNNVVAWNTGVATSLRRRASAARGLVGTCQSVAMVKPLQHGGPSSTWAGIQHLLASQGLKRKRQESDFASVRYKMTIFSWQFSK